MSKSSDSNRIVRVPFSVLFGYDTATAGFNLATLNLRVDSTSLGDRVEQMASCFSYWRLKSLRLKQFTDTGGICAATSSASFGFGVWHGLSYIPTASNSIVLPANTLQMSQLSRSDFDNGFRPIVLNMKSSDLIGDNIGGPQGWLRCTVGGTETLNQQLLSGGTIFSSVTLDQALVTGNVTVQVLIRGMIEFKGRTDPAVEPLPAPLSLLSTRITGKADPVVRVENDDSKEEYHLVRVK